MTVALEFRCIALQTETASRFRASGIDDGGNRIERRVSDGTAPCRHCLRLGSAGETMLLGSYALPKPHGIYGAASPIFVHAEPCERFEATNAIAPTVLANGLVSVRAYDERDFCLYDLGVVSEGSAAEAPLRRALADPRTAFVNVHTARPGCWLARAERLTA